MCAFLGEREVIGLLNYPTTVVPRHSCDRSKAFFARQTFILGRQHVHTYTNLCFTLCLCCCNPTPAYALLNILRLDGTQDDFLTHGTSWQRQVGVSRLARRHNTTNELLSTRSRNAGAIGHAWGSTDMFCDISVDHPKPLSTLSFEHARP